jgi:hypothetical protein
MSFVGTVDSLSIALRVFRSLGVEDQIREVRILVDHRDVKRQGDQNDAAIMLNSRLISLLHMMHVGPTGHPCGSEQDIGMQMRCAFGFGVEGKQLLPKVQFHVTSQEDEKTVSV